MDGHPVFFRALAGFLPLREGEVQLDGGAEETPLAEQAHYVGHADGLKAALTWRDSRFPGRAK